MGVVLGEDQRLGDGGATGKDLREELVAEGLQDEADLRLGGDGPVELLVGVLEVLLDRLESLLTGATVDLGDDRCLLYPSPSPRDRTRSRMPHFA